MEKTYFKGDSITLRFTANVNISSWMIRAQFKDENCNTIKLATSNVAGGSDSEIEITDTTNGVFLVKVAKNQTDCFGNNVFLEIEREDSSNDKLTIWKKQFPLGDQDLEWETK